MAKKQTRKTISMSRKTYERLLAYCVATDVSMSSVVESLVEKWMTEPVLPIKNDTSLPDERVADALAVNQQRKQS